MNQNGSPIESAIFSYDSATQAFSIYTSDPARAGSYALRMTVEYDDPCLTQSATLDFTVDVTTIDPDCLAATFTIATAILSSATTSLSHAIYHPDDSRTLDALTHVIPTPPATASCPTIALDVINSDDSPLGAEFTFVGNDFTILQNNDPSLDGTTYNLKVTAKYADAAYTNVGSLPFTVTFNDLCASTTLSIDSTIIDATINYSINDAADQRVLLVSKVSASPPTSYCPDIELTFDNSDGTPYDSSVFSVDSSSAPVSYQFSTQSTDDSKAGTYNLRVSAKYSDPIYSPVTLPFTVVIASPCVSLTDSG